MRRALVLGLGESGLAMARWLAQAGVHPPAFEPWELVVADTRAAPPMLEALRAELPGARFVGGAFDAGLLEGASLVALSPGLSPHQDGVRELLALAAGRGIDCAGEIELFARALALLRAGRDYAPALLGVTGTNGKTTTVRMAGRMIERAGHTVAVAGNVSPSALDALHAALHAASQAAPDAGALPQAWVLELSSFQLASTRSLACSAAAVLNLTEDHLDWHGSMADYAAAKERIFAPTTVRVLARDDAAVAAMAGRAPAGARVLTFGRGAPEAPGQYGIVRDGGLSWLAWTDSVEPPRRKRRVPRAEPGPDGVAPLSAPPPAAEPPAVHRLMPLDALPVRGTHNALNALAALALVQAIGVPLAPALHALAEFVPEPHRTESVAVVGGVEFVDDSKGTNVGATVAALRGLAEGAVPRRVVAILGGDGKGQSFAPLAEALRATARAVVLIGRDAPLIEAALQGSALPLERCADLPAAVRAAAARAEPGDIVLLSPACASFDMFRDYAHRAQVFVAAVHELARREAA
jgi:UDP-N-acetylmuramoylalanine--D-glutamate ligase